MLTELFHYVLQCAAMDYHPVSYKITKILEQDHCWFESFEHEPVRTSEEAARLRPSYSLRQGAKAIILRVKRSENDRFFVMLVMPADRKFDKDKVKALFGARDLRFATEAEITELTDGVQAGGVPPFGNLFGLRVVADPALFGNEKIVFNAGDRRFSVGMRAEDYKRLVTPDIVDITEP